MYKKKVRIFIQVIISFLISVLIILYPYKALSETDFIQNIQRIFNNTIQQIKDSQNQNQNKPINPNNVINQQAPNINSNRLSIEPNKTKTTSEIYINQPNIKLTCRSVNGCNIQITVQHKQTSDDNYTSFEKLKEESLKLSINTSTEININTQKGPFLINIKNLGIEVVDIDYSIKDLIKNPISNVPITTNQVPNNVTTSNIKDLGRIMFQKGKDNSYVFLITEELNKGKYKFHIIPSVKRTKLIFIPLKNEINISINLQDTKGSIKPIQIAQPEIIYLENPLINHKGILNIELDIKQNQSRICIVGIT
jgi:hypothetical protein